MNLRNYLRCRTCALLSSLLDNPYQYSGQVVAKLCVNIATMIWACVVIYKSDALIAWPGSASIFMWFHEDALAAALLLLSFFATLRLIFRSAPIRIGACVYGVLLMLWLYTWATLVVAISAGQTAMRPGQLAGVTVVAALAMFAFISNPKKRRHGSPSDQ